MYDLQITISHVLKAVLVCKGVLIEWVTVRGFDEPIDFDDLFAESRYAVFQKVQENTQAAMLHFFSPTLPDLAIKSYMASDCNQIEISFQIFY